MAPPVDEKSRELQVACLAGGAIELNEGHLHLGVPWHFFFAAGSEFRHGEVCETHSHIEQPVVAELPGRGNGGLDEVTEVVQLMSP